MKAKFEHLGGKKAHREEAKVRNFLSFMSFRYLRNIPSQQNIKRKSFAASLPSDDDEDDSDNASINSNIQSGAGRTRIRKGVVLSDDEDIPQPSRRKSKSASSVASKVDSEAERSLRAMMDIDDGPFILLLLIDTESEYPQRRSSHSRLTAYAQRIDRCGGGGRGRRCGYD